MIVVIVFAVCVFEFLIGELLEDTVGEDDGLQAKFVFGIRGEGLFENGLLFFEVGHACDVGVDLFFLTNADFLSRRVLGEVGDRLFREARFDVERRAFRTVDTFDSVDDCEFWDSLLEGCHVVCAPFFEFFMVSLCIDSAAQHRGCSFFYFMELFVEF